MRMVDRLIQRLTGPRRSEAAMHPDAEAREVERRLARQEEQLHERRRRRDVIAAQLRAQGGRTT